MEQLRTLAGPSPVTTSHLGEHSLGLSGGRDAIGIDHPPADPAGPDLRNPPAEPAEPDLHKLCGDDTELLAWIQRHLKENTSRSKVKAVRPLQLFFAARYASPVTPSLPSPPATPELGCPPVHTIVDAFNKHTALTQSLADMSAAEAAATAILIRDNLVVANRLHRAEFESAQSEYAEAAGTRRSKLLEEESGQPHSLLAEKSSLGVRTVTDLVVKRIFARAHRLPHLNGEAKKVRAHGMDVWYFLNRAAAVGRILEALAACCGGQDQHGARFELPLLPVEPPMKFPNMAKGKRALVGRMVQPEEYESSSSSTRMKLMTASRYDWLDHDQVKHFEACAKDRRMCRGVMAALGRDTDADASDGAGGDTIELMSQSRGAGT